MNIVSAGMLGPLLLRGNEFQVMQLAGIPPGLFPGVTYDVMKVQLVPEDLVLFFTNGLTDARSIHEEDFDLEGVKNV
jgi:serine phosphatase RsbU (regulator of sigma subunit)